MTKKKQTKRTPDERAALYLALKNQGLSYEEVAVAAKDGSSGDAVRNVIRRYNQRLSGSYQGFHAAEDYSNLLYPAPKTVDSTSEDFGVSNLVLDPQEELEIWTIDIERFPRIEYSWSAKKYSKFTPESFLVEDGRMISFAAKKLRGPTLFSSEYHHGREEMLNTLWHILNRADIVIGWNSRRFDVPHMDGELRDAGYKPYVPFKQIDLYASVRARFNYDYNTMKSVVKRWGLDEEKMENEGFGLWRRCMQNEKEAWDIMRLYNIQDVKSGEAAYLSNLAWLSGSIPNLGLWSDATKACPACGSSDVVEDGTTPTGVSRFVAYRCESCGYRARGKEKVASATLRPITR